MRLCIIGFFREQEQGTGNWGDVILNSAFLNMRFVFLLLFPHTVFGQSLKIDHEYFSLPNGLKVIFVHDSTAAATTVAVYYNVGFRNETKYQGGFAHLAEHM